MVLRTYCGVAYCSREPVEKQDEAKGDGESLNADKLDDNGVGHGEEDTREAPKTHTETHHGVERVEKRQKLKEEKKNGHTHYGK